MTVAAGAPALAEAKRNLYVGGNTSGDVATFDIDAAGALAPVGAPVAVGPAPRGVLLTPDGAHLYTANNGTISSFDVSAATGGLTPGAGSPLASGANLRSFAFTPDGRFAYFALRDDDQVQPFSVAANGALTALAPVAAGDQPQYPAVTPDGRFLYVGNFVSDNLNGYSIDATGALTPLPGFPIAGLDGAQAAYITPDGRFLLVVSDIGDNISVFEIAADGGLAQVTGSPFATGNEPRSAAVTPDGSRVFVANESDDNVSAFTIGANGALTQITGSPFPAGDEPHGAAVTPDGSRLYVSNFVSSDINAYDIAPSGALTQITGSPFPATVTGPEVSGLAITPDQPPNAAFVATPGVAGEPTSFNGSGSTDPDGTVARFDWDFGDGQSAANAGPTPSHTYAEPGTFQATLTVTDNEGCSTSQVWTGQSALCNGSTFARVQQQVVVRDGTPPKLKLKGKRTQRLDGPIEVKAKCDEECEAVASGKLTVKEEKGARTALAATKFKFKKVTKSLGAGASKTLKLKLKRKPLKQATKALEASGKSTAKIKVVATDDAGNEDESTLTVKVKEAR